MTCSSGEAPHTRLWKTLTAESLSGREKSQDKFFFFVFFYDLSERNHKKKIKKMSSLVSDLYELVYHFTDEAIHTYSMERFGPEHLKVES